MKIDFSDEMDRAKRRLAPVVDVKGRSVVVVDFDGPALSGVGTLSYTCSMCDTILAEGLADGQVWDVVIRCCKCEQHSEFARIPTGAVAAGYAFVPPGRHRIKETISTGGMLMIGNGVIKTGGAEALN